ncbi:hypothetical protein F8O07_06970 [Pseudoclavibacter sp. CFCC 13796]|uniref:NERD domain-containing protein n=1 Tax=Pseudoclavibacter sp. CFCC 13796 TaxID=2615179 RepID=UPI0013013BB6|nr:NERD domain-containing protein [Pseudoclavibacter sp. CFCC 13796]KAB1661641.1 hypothetical protein F8O07_06970 [Pseudoclavibacter sp. CFCC 13796]
MSSFSFRGWSKGAASRVYVDCDGRAAGHIDLVTGNLHPAPGCVEQLTAATAVLVSRLAGRADIPGDLALRPPGFMLTELLERTRTPDRRDRIRSGIAGEMRTARALNGMTGVRSLHSLPLAPDHDLDHVVCGGAGVVVVNTKSTVFDCTVDDTGVAYVGGHHQEWAVKARNDADALESMLRRSGVSAPVSCLVVVWAKTFTGVGRTVVPGERLTSVLSGMGSNVSAAVVDAAYEVMRHPSFWESTARMR